MKRLLALATIGSCVLLAGLAHAARMAPARLHANDEAPAAPKSGSAPSVTDPLSKSPFGDGTTRNSDGSAAATPHGGTSAETPAPAETGSNPANETNLGNTGGNAGGAGTPSGTSGGPREADLPPVSESTQDESGKPRATALPGAADGPPDAAAGSATTPASPTGARREADYPGGIRNDVTAPVIPESTRFVLPTPQSQLDRDAAIRDRKRDGMGGWDLIGQLLLALLIIGIIGGAAVWILRRNPGMKRFFGGGPMQVVSRAYIAPRVAVYLLKVGDRVLVVGSGPGGALSTLSEITDPVEITRLLADVESAKPDSSSALFRDTLRKATGGRAAASGGSAGEPAGQSQRNSVRATTSTPADARPSGASAAAPAAPAAGAAPRRTSGSLDIVEGSDVRQAATAEPGTGASSKARIDALRETLQQAKARINA